VSRGRSAFPIVGQDALDQFRIGFLIDEELADAAGPGADVGEELLKTLDAARGERCDAFLGPVDDVDHLAVVDVVGIGGDDLERNCSRGWQSGLI